MLRKLKRNFSSEKTGHPIPSKVVVVDQRKTDGGISWCPAWTGNRDDERKDWRVPVPVIVPRPLKQAPVYCNINRQTSYKPSWEFGDLFFIPDQKEVPILMSDSMCRDLQRHPRAIHVIRSGATTAQIVNCFKSLEKEIQDRLPYKLWVILVAGGNDLCGSNLAGSSSQRLAREVIDPFQEMDDLCENRGYRLTIAHTIPRPREQGNNTRNLPDKRKIIADALGLVHNWIKHRNERKNEKPLKLCKFFEHSSEDERRSAGRKRAARNRAYWTGQQKIRETRFADDAVHIVGQGISSVESALYELIDETNKA